MPTVLLTQAFIDHGLMCPTGRKSIEYIDSEGSGVYVEVQANKPGIGRFHLRKKMSGKTLRRPLGPTTEKSLAEAKALAKAFLDEAKGKSITLDVHTLSMNAFAVKYFEYKRQHMNSKSHESLWERRISLRFGKKRLFEVTRMDVENYLMELSKSGLAASTCNHHIRLLRNMLNVAVQWDLLQKNVLAGIRLLREDNERNCYLDQKSLEHLMHVLNTHPNRTICLLAKFLLYTGCRLNEALKSTWDAVSYENKTFTVPASNSKSKKVLVKPLSDDALAVLDELKVIGNNHPSNRIFISSSTGNVLSNAHKSWSRIASKHGLEGLTYHSFRHHYASTLANSNISIYTIKELLGHSSLASTSRYSHLSSETLHAANSAASDQISGAAKKAS